MTKLFLHIFQHLIFDSFRMSAFRAVGWCGLVCMVFFSSVLSVQASHKTVFEANQVKAVFLYNLTKFVNWPKEKIRGENRPFVIGVLGIDPFGDSLDRAVSGEFAYGRRIAVRRFQYLGQVEWQKVDLLFVTAMGAEQSRYVFTQARRNNVLTVSDVPDFCRHGGMINLLTTGSRINIEINSDQTRKGGFRVSAQLLKLAKIVPTSTGENQ